MASYLPIPQWFYADGRPLAAGKIATKIHGTSTNQVTYQDADEEAENTNPIILDSGGRADIWLSASQPYDIYVYDSNDNLIQELTDISGAGIITSISSTLTSNLDFNGFNAIFDDNTGLIGPEGSAALKIVTASNTPDYVSLEAGLAGAGPNLKSASSSTNSDFSITPKGTGEVNLNTNIVNISGSTTQAGELRLFEDGDNGTDYIAIKAPAAIASNVTITLPSTTGTPLIDANNLSDLLSASDARDNLELGTSDSPTFTDLTLSDDLSVAGDITASGTIELGHASDTTLSRASAGNVNIEGNLIYRAGGTDVPVADGGTGASDASTARTNLGLGTIATQDADDITVTGGTLGGIAITSGEITGIIDLAVADGGTGASTATNARTNLGVAIGTDIPSYAQTGSFHFGYTNEGSGGTSISINTVDGLENGIEINSIDVNIVRFAFASDNIGLAITLISEASGELTGANYYSLNIATTSAGDTILESVGDTRALLMGASGNARLPATADHCWGKITVTRLGTFTATIGWQDGTATRMATTVGRYDGATDIVGLIVKPYSGSFNHFISSNVVHHQ